MQHEAAKTYAFVIDQFRNRPTPALMNAALELAKLPVGDATDTALDIALFILAERIDIAEFNELINKIEKINEKNS
jgi:hypothetical protein